MIERLLYSCIQQGITFLKANPIAIERLFGEDALLDDVDKLTEPQKVSELFVARPPTVQHSFPSHKDPKFPCYCITLASDATSQQFVGDDGEGFISDPLDPDAGGFRESEVRSYNFVLLVFSQHPDYTLYLFHLLLWMLTNARSELQRNGLMNMRTSGADVMPDQKTMPAGLFVRRLTFSCDREYAQVPLADKLPVVAFRVSGVHWDAPSAGDVGADTGGVIGKVTTPYDGGEDDGDEEGFLG